MKRASIALFAMAVTFVANGAIAQNPAFNRFTDELTQTLESDAATVLTRGMFIDFAKKVCARLSGPAAAEMEGEANAWVARNERFMRASSIALNEIGGRLLAEGGEDMRQGYFYTIRDASAKQVVAGIKRVFNGAELDNSVTPLPHQCLLEAARLRSQYTDIKNSPNLTRALLPYMERRGLDRD